jgi:hypothetical protein
MDGIYPVFTYFRADLKTGKTWQIAQSFLSERDAREHVDAWNPMMTGYSHYTRLSATTRRLRNAYRVESETLVEEG